jgi:hypothetical protein
MASSCLRHRSHIHNLAVNNNNNNNNNNNEAQTGRKWITSLKMATQGDKAGAVFGLFGAGGGGGGGRNRGSTILGAAWNKQSKIKTQTWRSAVPASAGPDRRTVDH